jgi:transcriptional regulator with XRE-family HTH domain
MPMPKPDIDRRRLGELLREAREYLELSQDEVAKQMNLPRTAISFVESGQRKVDALELKQFSQLYQRPVAYFTGEEEAISAVPENVAHLARTASKLSDKDREELTRFAEFLGTRATSRS